MKNNRSWMDGLPIAGRAFARLEKVCNEWAASDGMIVEKMETFFTSLNELVDDITEFRQAGEHQGFSALTRRLKAAEPTFLDIQVQFHKLDELGRKL